MPPKKNQKEEEVDLSTLPEWFPINCVFKFDCKKQRADALKQKFVNQPLSFQKNITKEEIANFATEKGLYINPETLTEKQKKDPKLLEGMNLELTPEVIAKAFVQYQQEKDIEGRKLKKQQIEEAENPTEEVVDDKKGGKKDAKKDTKKDAKKDAKKGGKNEVPVEEEKVEEVIPEKEYKKALDCMYFLLDLPQDKPEVLAFSQNKAQIDLIIHIRQKVLTNTGDQDMSLLEAKDDFEQDLKNRMDNFIENNGKEEGEDYQEHDDEEQEGQEGEGEEEDQENVVKRHKEVITEEDEAFIKQNNNFVKMISETRAQASRDQEIRKVVVKEYIWEIDPYAEEESLKNFMDFLIEEICQFSFDSQEFQKWISDKKEVPLEKIAAQKKAAEQAKREKAEQEAALKAAEEAKEAEEAAKKGGKKDKPAKKDAKKEAEVEEEKPVEEKQEEEIDEAELQDQIIQKAQEPYFTYNKQLSSIQLEETGPGIILEALLDDIQSNQNIANSNNPQNPKQKDEDSQVDDILGSLSNYVAFMKQDGLENYKEQEQYLGVDNKSTTHKVIIDEIDEISKKAQHSKLYNLDSVLQRDRNICNNLLFPGIDRNLMPEIPDKSEAIRKAEKSAVYPFIQCQEHEFERRLVLTRFEDLLKENEPEREWNFQDRLYIERHNQNTLSQTLYKAQLFEPILVYKYNEKDDNLFLAMYYKNPPGRILRTKWSAEWKVMPNLENWINFFKPNENNLRNEIYYDIDYQQIGNLHEKIKYMYPTDNSIILGQKFQVSDDFYYRYKVLKEQVVFGIKENKEGERNSQFWAQFDCNNTRFVVELERKQDLKLLQQLQEDEARYKREEEQAALESQQNLQSKHDLEKDEIEKKGKKLSVKEQALKEEQIQQQIKEAQEKLEQEKIERQQRQNFERKSKLQSVLPTANFSLTQENGLVVKFLQNGDVFQQQQLVQQRPLGRRFEEFVDPSSIGNQPNSDIETKRIISGKGSVLRYFKDGSILVYYANGNTSYTQGRNSPWITTNNKGFRKSRSKTGDKEEQQYDAIPCSRRTDPESGAKIIIRGDETIIITYPNDSTYCKFKDGTEITTNAKKDQIVVENIDFATIKVTIDEVKARTDTTIGIGSAYADVGFDSLFERSNDGRIVDTYLPDGIHVRGYREKNQLPGYEQFEKNNIHLVYFPDGSVSKVTENGEVLFISGVDRVNLNNKSASPAVFGEDKEYWVQLFCVQDERKAGVYTIDLRSKQLWTRDDQGNFFGLSSDGEIISKIAVSLNIGKDDQNQLERPGTPDIQDGELFIEEENKFLPLPEEIVPPRLFVINNDNTGFEILEEAQISNYKRLKEQDNVNVKIIEDEHLKYENCDSQTFITHFKTLQQQKKKFITPVIPRNLDIMPNTYTKQQEPTTQTFLFRNFLKFQQFDSETRAQHNQDIEKFEQWKKEGLKQQADFGILVKSQEEKDKEFNIQLKILESRKRDYQSEVNTYDKIKQSQGEQFIDSFDKIMLSLQKNGSNRISVSDLNQLEDSPIEEQQEKQKLASEIKEKQIQKEKQLQEEFLKRSQQKQKTEQEQKFQDSIAAQGNSAANRFVKHYWITIDGKLAFDHMLEQKLVSLQPPNKKNKKISVEDINRSINERANSQGSLGNTMGNMQHAQQQSIEQQQQQQQEMLRNSNNNFNNTQGSQKQQYSTQRQQLRALKEEQTQANIIKPSVFTQRDIEDEEIKIQDAQKAYDYRKQKTQDFNVYGGKRNVESESKKVPCLLRTNPQSELNQKYIITDSLTDNRLKLSSLATRMYGKAPSIQELRQTGSHTALARTIDKKYNLDDVENKKNLMITADLNDNLRRDLLITPIQARFGVVKIGGEYQITVVIKNEDLLAQRIVIKQPENNKFVKVIMKQMGPIALGLSREIVVRLTACEEIFGRFKDQFQIVSKHQIYTIPIYANVIEEHEYNRLDQESRETKQRPILKNTVQEIKTYAGNNSNIQDSKQDFMESQQSDLLPKLPKYDKNYKIDPYQSMHKNKKKNEDDEDYDEHE